MIRTESGPPGEIRRAGRIFGGVDFAADAPRSSRRVAARPSSDVGRQRLHGRKPARSASGAVSWNCTFFGLARRAAHEGRQYTPASLPKEEGSIGRAVPCEDGSPARIGGGIVSAVALDCHGVVHHALTVAETACAAALRCLRSNRPSTGDAPHRRATAATPPLARAMPRAWGERRPRSRRRAAARHHLPGTHRAGDKRASRCSEPSTHRCPLTAAQPGNRFVQGLPVVSNNPVQRWRPRPWTAGPRARARHPHPGEIRREHLVRRWK